MAEIRFGLGLAQSGVRAAIKSRRCREIYKLPESQRRAPLLAPCSPFYLFPHFPFLRSSSTWGFINHQNPTGALLHILHQHPSAECPAQLQIAQNPISISKSAAQILLPPRLHLPDLPITESRENASYPDFQKKKKRVLLAFSFPLVMSFNCFSHFPTQ